MTAHPCEIVPSREELVLHRREMVPRQSRPRERLSRPYPCPEREPNQSTAQEGEPNQSMFQEAEPIQSVAPERTSPKPNPESMYMEGEFCLAMTQESMHALGVRIPNLDRRLSLNPIATLHELMPYCLLPREG